MALSLVDATNRRTDARSKASRRSRKPRLPHSVRASSRPRSWSSSERAALRMTLTSSRDTVPFNTLETKTRCSVIVDGEIPWPVEQ